MSWKGWKKRKKEQPDTPRIERKVEPPKPAATVKPPTIVKPAEPVKPDIPAETDREYLERYKRAQGELKAPEKPAEKSDKPLVTSDVYKPGFHWDYKLGKYVEGEYKSAYTYSGTYGSGYSHYYDDFDEGDYSQYFGKKEKGKSSSSWWSSRYTSWSWGKSDKPDYEAILASIQRSANILRNAVEGEDEKELKVHWSDGTQANKANDDSVYLSPEVVQKEKTRKPGWSEDERTDVLIGEVFAESTMKRTMDPKVEAKMVPKGQGNLEEQMDHALWHTAEHIEAETTVVRDYPGFKGYFAAHRDYFTDADAHDRIQKFLNEEENATHATLALLWEMLHPTEHLKLPKDTEALVKAGFERIGEAETSKDRMHAAEEVIQSFIKKWPLPPNQERQEEMKQRLKAQAMGLGKDRGEVVKGDDDSDGEDESDRPDTAIADLVKIVSRAEKYEQVVHHKVAVTRGCVTQYQKLLMQLRGQIRELQTRLKYRNELNRISEHGLRRGDLDEGSLYKLGFYPLGYDDPYLFEKEEIKLPPDVVVCILVDESGSMAHLSAADGRRRCLHARNAAIVIANAVLGIRGMQVCVLGHTAEGFGQDLVQGEELILHHYFTPERSSERYLASMARIGAFCNNLDGHAIAHAAALVTKWYPETPRRLLIHVSDGQPAAGRYGGEDAYKHMRHIVTVSKKAGVEVIGLGIDGAFSERQGREMYGEGRSACISAREQTTVMGNLITKYALR